MIVKARQNTNNVKNINNQVVRKNQRQGNLGNIRGNNQGNMRGNNQGNMRGNNQANIFGNNKGNRQYIEGNNWRNN